MSVATEPLYYYYSIEQWAIVNKNYKVFLFSAYKKIDNAFRLYIIIVWH